MTVDDNLYSTVRTENGIIAQSIQQITDGMRTDNQQSVFLNEKLQTLQTYQSIAWIVYIFVWIALFIYVVFLTNVPLTTTTKIFLIAGFLLWMVLAMPIEFQIYRALYYLYTLLTGTPYTAPSNAAFPMMTGIKF
jgi:hypothetical protein